MEVSPVLVSVTVLVEQNPVRALTETVSSGHNSSHACNRILVISVFFWNILKSLDDMDCLL